MLARNTERTTVWDEYDEPSSKRCEPTSHAFEFDDTYAPRAVGVLLARRVYLARPCHVFLLWDGEGMETQRSMC